jgi:5-deoxy-glucuronate isomerase
MQRSSEWFFPNGSLAAKPWESVVDDSIPDWRYTGIRVGTIAPGATLELEADAVERIIVPLAGRFEVDVAGPREPYRLAGRASVFDGPTDVLYVGALEAASISGTGRVAIAEAPATDVYPTTYLARDDVPVELRGAGNSSRQVHNFGVPGVLAADRLIVCEVITPAGNWSSYPPHKHDEHSPGHESRLEEIYYFESEPTRGSVAPAVAAPFGLMRTYSSAAGTIDTNAEVRTGDVALVPFGWHGPCVAAPGYDLYYLNVMAGPDPEREWLISDDPAHAWVRASWDDQQIDRRLPYTRSTENT